MKIWNFILFNTVLGISFFIFNNSFAVKDFVSREPSSQTLGENTEKKEASISQKPVFKVTSQGLNLPQETASKKTNTNKKASEASESLFLEKKPYKPIVKKEILKLRFDKHLKVLKENCDLKFKERRLGLDKKLKDFISFLTESLKDPYMDYEIALLFGDVLSLMEKENLETSEVFNLVYRLLYNLREDLKFKDYQDQWAKVISTSIKCSEVVSA